MKSLLRFLLAVLIASSSAFFVLGGNAEVAEAKTCKPGEFPHLQSDFTVECKNPVAAGNNTDNSDQKVQAIQSYMLTFLKVLIVFSSTITVIVITYAGYLYITSEGNFMKTDQAKQMLFRAGIGILVLSLSFVIMNLLSTTAGIAW